MRKLSLIFRHERAYQLKMGLSRTLCNLHKTKATFLRLLSNKPINIYPLRGCESCGIKGLRDP